MSEVTLMTTSEVQHTVENDSTEKELSGDPFWRCIPRLEGTSSKIVSVVSENGIVRYQSDPIKWLLGYDADVFVGRALRKFLDPGSYNLLRDALERMAEDEEAFDQWRFRFRTASGGRRQLEGMASNFLRDPRLGGILVYWRGLPG